MYKDRLTKWKISKNVRASDIKTIVRSETDAESQPEFYIVAGRVIRADRLQQAMQRRATVARRAQQKTTKSLSPTEPEVFLDDFTTLASSSIPPQLTPPTSLLIPEQILLQTRTYITTTFAAQSTLLNTPLVDITLAGPIQRCRLAFEETLANLSLVAGLDHHVAFRSLHGAFELLRPCLHEQHDPQFLVIFLQIMSLCLWFRKPDIMRMVIAYVAELSSVVLGVRHPLAVICQGFQEVDVEGCRAICKVVSEAAWYLFRGYLHPFRLDSFVHLTGSYADTLDSLGLYGEAERFLRYVVETSVDVPVDRRLHLELHLVMTLRRQRRYPEALTRLEEIRREILEHEPMLMRESQERTVELTYQTLRINALCECDGGDKKKGREFFREAFALMQEKKGRYSPRTTRALRDVIRYGAGDEDTIRDLEDRLARFSVETENFL